ncbi:TPA: hypothetical protein N0F65_009967 [Lagenidium giganteum]|uniref:Expansin-like EG45 domain-containing protein n=1 Tax=Lagenidium giganteum TaxID=4803 RepID=A0AAV2YY69_9STRA|nr:TPA: hypothetical protein N0F65_009967 [Lagenidium giganteum]
MLASITTAALVATSVVAASTSATAAAAAAASAAVETKFQGYARNTATTDYLPNKCYYDNIWGDRISAGESHFAYVLKPDWHNASVCGQCATVKVTGATGSARTRPVTVLITSYDDNVLCPTGDPRCQPGSLLLSTQAYRDMFYGTTPSSAPIEWELVPCPDDFVKGNVEFFFHPGTSNGYISLQPRNFRRAVGKIELEYADGTVAEFGQPGDIVDYGSYRTLLPANPDALHQGFTIRAYARDSDDTVEVHFDKIPAGSSTVQADGQF